MTISVRACLTFASIALSVSLQPSVVLGQNNNSLNSETSNVIASTVNQSLESKNFSRLERLANEYRTTLQKLPGGGLSIIRFYESMYSYDLYGSEINPRIQIADAWLKARPKSPTPYIAKAIQHVNLYHNIRQLIAVDEKAGVTSSKEEYERKARAQLDTAYKILTKHEKRLSSDPYYHNLLMVVASLRDAGEAELIYIYEKGASTDFVTDGFFNATIIGFSRLWNRDKFKIDTLARRIVAGRPPEQRAEVYASLYWVLTEHYASQTPFQDWSIDWPLMKQGMTDMLTQYPDAETGSWFALFACLAGDREKTRELWAMVESFPSQQIWATPMIYRGCESFAFGADPSPVQPAGPEQSG